MKIIGVNLNLVKTVPLGLYGFFCVLFLSGFFIISCGSGSENSSSIKSAEFIPAIGDGSPVNFNTIYLNGSGSKREFEEFMVLDVNANISGQVVIAKFDIDFSGSVIQYEDYSSGNFFGVEDEVLYVDETSSNNPNRVSITISRNDLSARTGMGVFISLIFRLVGERAGHIDFNNEELRGSINGQNIAFTITWLGGTINPR